MSSLRFFNQFIDELEGRHVNVFQLSKYTEKIILNFYYLTLKENFDASSKANTYKLFKEKPSLEIYLEHLKDFRYIKTLTKFRLSDHKLMIEEGRRRRPKVEKAERLCIYCDKMAVEDEIHFLLDCEKYTAERNIFLQKIGNFYPNFLRIAESKAKLIFLMSQENTEDTKIIANFIHKTLIVRDSSRINC